MDKEQVINNLGQFGQINNTTLSLHYEAQIGDVAFYAGETRIEATWFNSSGLREMAYRLMIIADILDFRS